MKSHVLDILFENRNKAYGAYDLRKFYNDRLKKALGIIIVMTAALCAFTFLPRKKGYETSSYTIPEDTKLGQVKKSEVKPPEIKPKTSIPVQTNVATAKLVPNIKIVPDKDSSDNLDIDLDKLAIGNTTTNPINPGGPQIIAPPGNGSGDNTEPVKPVIDKTVPISDPEIMPSYPGGMEALRKFLQRNLQNPKDMEEGELVSVRIKFVVGYNGKLQSFVTVEDGGEEFNKEVIRVLKKMPDWIPGKSNGENVSVYFTIPVKFVPAN